MKSRIFFFEYRTLTNLFPQFLITKKKEISIIIVRFERNQNTIIKISEHLRSSSRLFFEIYNNWCSFIISFISNEFSWIFPLFRLMIIISHHFLTRRHVFVFQRRSEETNRLRRDIYYLIEYYIRVSFLFYLSVFSLSFLSTSFLYIYIYIYDKNLFPNVILPEHRNIIYHLLCSFYFAVSRTGENVSIHFSIINLSLVHTFRIKTSHRSGYYEP